MIERWCAERIANYRLMIERETETRVRAECQTEIKELRECLSNAPDNNCNPVNDCYDDCCSSWEGWREDLLGERRLRPHAEKPSCKTCGSKCFPSQLVEGVCRWCQRREIGALIQQARDEARDDDALMAEEIGRIHLAAAIRAKKGT